jgi:hypothetical protein
LTTAQQKEVDTANQTLQAELAKLNQATKANRGQVTLDAAKSLEQMLAGKDPAVQKAILEQNQKFIGQLTGNLGFLDGQQTQTAIGHLARATQSVGQQNAALLTDAMAPHLKQSLVQDPNNPQTQQNLGELTNAVRASVAGGDGALFGASLSQSLNDIGEAQLSGAVGDATQAGINELQQYLALAQNALNFTRR